MSLKPIKKSDADKDWIRPRRKTNRTIAPEYHLIVSEGTETEPNYFEYIKKIINLKYKGRIEISVEGTGYNTESLFYKAKELAFNNTNGFRHVWIIYDTDSFKAEHINKVVELCRSNSTAETTYHAIWSNQCIELWYILHFEYLHSDIDRSAYSDKITKHIEPLGFGEYRKNRDDMFTILRPYLDTAIKYAKKLKQSNGSNTPADSKPGTEVYRLMEKLKRYL